MLETTNSAYYFASRVYVEDSSASLNDFIDTLTQIGQQVEPVSSDICKLWRVVEVFESDEDRARMYEIGDQRHSGTYVRTYPCYLQIHANQSESGKYTRFTLAAADENTLWSAQALLNNLYPVVSQGKLTTFVEHNGGLQVQYAAIFEKETGDEIERHFRSEPPLGELMRQINAEHGRLLAASLRLPEGSPHTGRYADFPEVYIDTVAHSIGFTVDDNNQPEVHLVKRLFFVSDAVYKGAILVSYG